MNKYAFMGLFLTIALILVSAVYINHGTNTSNMGELDVGIKTSMMGYQRDDGEKAKSNATYGMRAKDVVTSITEDVVSNQSNMNKTVTIDFKFFTDEEGKDFVDYDRAINENMVVKSVQYKVNLYNSKDVKLDGQGNPIIKEGSQAESSTENRIVLNKLK